MLRCRKCSPTGNKKANHHPSPLFILALHPNRQRGRDRFLYLLNQLNTGAPDKPARLARKSYSLAAGDGIVPVAAEATDGNAAAVLVAVPHIVQAFPDST